MTFAQRVCYGPYPLCTKTYLCFLLVRSLATKHCSLSKSSRRCAPLVLPLRLPPSFAPSSAASSMSSSVVERTRALHADTEEMRERLMNTINKHAHSVSTTHKRTSACASSDKQATAQEESNRRTQLCRSGIHSSGAHSALLCSVHVLQAKDRILLDHELKHQLEELCACQAKLLELYEDKDGSEHTHATERSKDGQRADSNSEDSSFSLLPVCVLSLFVLAPAPPSCAP